MRQKRFLSLMKSFLDREIQAQPFCTRFTKLWTQERDMTLAKKAEWPQPYDEQITAAFQRGEITGTQFSEQFAELWGYDPDTQEIYDALHSACDCYYPFPEREGEIDEEQLRHEVEEAFATLTNPAKQLVQAA